MIPFVMEELSWGRISCSLRRCQIFFRSKILMGIIQVYINDEEVMKMELGFSQWCSVTGLEAVDTKGKQEIPFNMSKYFSAVRVTENLAWEVAESLSLEMLKPLYAKSWAAWCSWACSEQGCGLGDLQMYLPASLPLWFWRVSWGSPENVCFTLQV